MFKLMQMQKIDKELLTPIAHRFKELDVDGNGAGHLGLDCQLIV